MKQWSHLKSNNPFNLAATGYRVSNGGGGLMVAHKSFNRGRL